MKNRLGYQPVLDGIRGVALLSVITFNLEWHCLPGGFFGMGVFFALSEYQIRTLLSKY